MGSPENDPLAVEFEGLKFCIKNGLSCLEFAAGVPATIGGMVTMNFGCWGTEVSDIILSVQICDENGNVFIIQPNKNNYKAPNLVSLLENEKILKIGHFLRFDKNALEYFLKCKMKNIFDTKIASKIVRTYTDQHGLKNLVFEFCNKNLDKRQGSSDWNKDLDELTDKQLELSLIHI